MKVDFTGTIDGVEFPGGQAKDFDITVGEGRMLPEFETAITGMKAGETKSFALTFPADYHGKEVAGKAGPVRADGRRASTRPDVPPLDSAFATAFGIKSGKVEDLRAEVESNLRLELKRKIETVLRDQAMRALREKTQLALPKSLVEMEAGQLDAPDGGQPPAAGHEAGRHQAHARTCSGRRPRSGWRSGSSSASSCARKSLLPKPEQVKAMVQEIAQTYEQPDAVVRWHYEKPERLADFEGMAIEHNVDRMGARQGAGEGRADVVRDADGARRRASVSRGGRVRSACRQAAGQEACPTLDVGARQSHLGGLARRVYPTTPIFLSLRRTQRP